MKLLSNPFVFISITLIILTGCSGLGTKQATPDSIISQVNDQAYDQAISDIDQLNPDHPHFQELVELLPELQKQRRDYVTQVLEDAEKLSASNQWHSALELLKQAQNKVPSSPEFNNQITNIENRRQKFISRQADQIILKEAIFLLEKNPKVDEIVKANPDDRYWRREQIRLKRRTITVAKLLHSLAQDYFDKKHYSLAQQANALAHQLAPNKATEELKIELLTIIDKRKVRKERTLRQKQNLLAKTLVIRFEQAMASDNLLLAQSHLKELNKIAPDWPDLNALEVQWKDRSEVAINIAIQKGRLLYSQGSIEEALSVWEQVHPLQPANPQINDYIAKAKTFLKNLDEFSQSNN